MYKNNSNKVGILSMLFFEDHVIRHRKKYRFIYVESTGVNMQDKHYLGQILFCDVSQSTDVELYDLHCIALIQF